MPFTKDGVIPTFIFNPSGMPKRMTVGKLYEILVGNWCSEKGTQTDGTMFREINIDSISAELEDLGMDCYGYHKLYSGITGESMDAKIFMGPIYYQRLQRFALDSAYSIAHGPSDALTNQPLDGGKRVNGGLKIGEMEKDVLASHGGAKFLAEKFFAHSDGYTEYICRCGKSAIVNIKLGIYKCNYCKDNANILAYPTSWSSKTFIQELESINVGIKRKPKPYVYNVEYKSDVFDKMKEITHSK